MRLLHQIVVITAVMGCLLGCGSQESAETRKQEANTPAGKTGKVAYNVAKETGKAAEVIGHKLAVAAHQAHQGWKEAASEDKKKK